MLTVTLHYFSNKWCHYCRHIIVMAVRTNAVLVKTLGNRYSLKDQLNYAFEEELKKDYGRVLINLGNDLHVMTDFVEGPIVAYV